MVKKNIYWPPHAQNLLTRAKTLWFGQHQDYISDSAIIRLGLAKLCAGLEANHSGATGEHVAEEQKEEK